MNNNPRGEHLHSPLCLFTPSSSRQGFTLIELSIVLVIIGILVSLGASVLGPLTKRAKFAETREAVKAMKEAVINYTVSRHELPCSDTTDAAETCSNPDARFNTLGNSTDSTQRALFYIYSSNLRQDGATNIDMCLPLLAATNISLRICHNAAVHYSTTSRTWPSLVGSRGPTEQADVRNGTQVPQHYSGL